MADVDGEYLGDTIGNTSTSIPEFNISQTGWYSQTDSLVVATNHYHKRGWRTESSAYVEWESTDRNTPYPGGGTVEPVVGVVIYQWVTYSNSS